MKLILVPIDFSADSINALEHAIKFANKLNANLRMMHIEQKNFETPLYFRDLEDFKEKSAKDFLNLVMYRFQGKVKNNLDYKIIKGNISKEIVKIAEEDEANFIIMGTHGISRNENSSWMGSNAFKVVTSAPCPVLTIRNGFLRNKISKIVLPIDASKHTRRKLTLTADMAEIFNSEIHVVGVTETSLGDILKRVDSWVNQSIDYLNQRKIPYKTIMLQGYNITDMTIDYAKSIDADLITIMTDQGQHPVSLLMGPYAQHMVNNSPIPILTIRPNIYQ